MKKVFLLSDYFTVQMLSYELGCTLNIEFDEIVLLEENHKNHPLIWEEYPFKVVVLKTLEQCVTNSDIIIIFNNATIPDKTINYVKQVSSEKNKQLYIFNTPDFIIDAILQNETINCAAVYDNKCGKGANILIMNIGALSLSYDVEVLTAKVLTSINASYEQFFLQSTRLILNQYQQSGILNNKYFDINKTKAAGSDISVISVDIGHNIENIVKYAIPIIELCADYIIVVADGNYANKLQAIDEHVKYCLNKTVDMFILSPFCVVGKQHVINHMINNSLCDRCFYITDPQLDIHLKNDILRKLSFPMGIKLYN